MSQTSIPNPTSSVASSPAATNKPVLTLTDMVDSAAVNLKKVEFAKSALGSAIFMFTTALLVILIDHWVLPLPVFVRWICLATILFVTAFWMLRKVVPLFGRKINPVYAAREIERKVPELKDSLVSYMQLNNTTGTAPKGVVTAVGKYAVDRLSRHDIGEFIASTTPLKLAMWLLATIVFASVYFVVSPKSGFDSLLRLVMPWNKIEAPTRVKIVKLSPKDAIVARGQSLDIEIELRGFVGGDKVQIEYTSSDGQYVNQVIPMAPIIEGLTYKGKLSFGPNGIEQPVQYQVRAGDCVAGPYHVDVEIIPLVAVQKLELRFPPYTKLPPQSIDEPSDFEAIEGTDVRVFAQANQKTETGRIEVHPLAKEDDPLNTRRTIAMQTNDRSLVGNFQLTLNKKKEDPSNGSYRINAISALGQPNGDPIIYGYQVTADQAPIIKWAEQYPETIELPINHVGDFKLLAFDKDFGLSHLRTVLYRGRSKLDETTLLHNEVGIVNNVERTWRFEPIRMGLRPGDELTLQAFASDNRRDLQNTRWEPNISSTSILKIFIKPESNEPTETSAPKDQAEPLPDQPVDGSDIPQPQDQPSKDQNKDNQDGQSEGTQSEGAQSEGAQGEGADSQSNENQANGKEPAESSKQDAGSSEQGAGQDNSSTGSDSNKTGDSNSSQPDATSNTSGKAAGNSGKEQTSAPQSNDSAGTQSAGKSGGQNSDSTSDEQNPMSGQPKNDSSGNAQTGNNQSAQNKPQEGSQQNGSQQNGSQQNGSQQNGSQQSGSQQNGSQQNGSQQNGSQQSGSQQNGSQQNGSQQNGSQQNGSQQNGSQQNDGAESSSGASESGAAESSTGNAGQNAQPGDNSNTNASGNSSKQGSSGPTGNGNSTQSANGDNQPNSSMSPSNQSGNSSSSGTSGQSGNPSAEKNSVNSGASYGDKSQSPNRTNSPNGSKGRLDDVAQSSPGSNAPYDDGSAFEEIKKWMDQNGAPKPAQNNQPEAQKDNSSPGSNPAPQSTSKKQITNDAQSQSSNSSKSDSQSGSETGTQDQNQNQQEKQTKAQTPDAKSGTGYGSNSTPSDQQNSPMQGGDKQGGDKQGGDKQGGQSGEPGSGQSSGSAGQPGSEGAQSSQGTPSGQPGAQGTGTGQDQASGEPGARTGSSSSGEGAESPTQQISGPTTPSEANLEYTKELTDMALEYLDRQRDQPDPELLKRLGWTADDLRSFVDRWKGAKERGITPGGVKPDYLQDLRALGITPDAASTRNSKGSDDRIRGLNEEGGRTKPPRSLQSQYEAFRRAAQEKTKKD